MVQTELNTERINEFHLNFDRKKFNILYNPVIPSSQKGPLVSLNSQNQIIMNINHLHTYLTQKKVSKKPPPSKHKFFIPSLKLVIK